LYKLRSDSLILNEDDDDDDDDDDEVRPLYISTINFTCHKNLEYWNKQRIQIYKGMLTFYLKHYIIYLQTVHLTIIQKGTGRHFPKEKYTINKLVNNFIS